MIDTYQVCIPHTFRDFFDYRIEGDRVPKIGARVWVPFRNTIKLGLVIDKNASEKEIAALKAIQEIIDEDPLLSAELLNLCRWVGKYYQSPLSEVIPLALPKKYRNGNSCTLPCTESFYFKINADDAHAQIPARALRQHALIDFLSQFTKPVAKKMLLEAGFTSAQLKSLVQSQILAISTEVDLPYPLFAKPALALELNGEQRQAVETISQHLNHYQSFLLHGVTGSGKTEVYLQVIEKILAMDKQVLVLVPEIGLTPQLLARFRARINQPMAVLHSHLNETERQTAWQLAKDKLVKLIIGTRTAVFTPLPNLGLIILDEEHDASFKQMEGVRYSARDTALIRAHFANIPIILGSATPSLESLYNVRQGKYQLLRLEQKALNQIPLHYRLLDIRSLPLHQGLALPALAIMQEHLQKNNQVLVFINRRGFSPVLLCHNCGWMADCKACDAHLTLHRKDNRLICHHCGLLQIIPTTCPSCQNRELIPVGAGTQRVHEFLTSYFPNNTVLRIDRDEVSHKNAFDKRLELIHSGEAQLIVGTQMLAKGHHFPRLSLVVILDTDAGFYNQDFRALERLGQLLIQVAGRAGRALEAGEVVIQTHLPEHPLLNCLIQKGYDAFSNSLLEARQQSTLPPYHYLAILRAQSNRADRVLHFLHTAKQGIDSPAISLFGPAPAPLLRKANQFRMQLLLKSPSRSQLSNQLSLLRQKLMNHKAAQGVRWNIDVDPIDLA